MWTFFRSHYMAHFMSCDIFTNKFGCDDDMPKHFIRFSQLIVLHVFLHVRDKMIFLTLTTTTSHVFSNIGNHCLITWYQTPSLWWYDVISEIETPSIGDYTARYWSTTMNQKCFIYMGNSPVTGECPAQKPVTRSFDVFWCHSENGT